LKRNATRVRPFALASGADASWRAALALAFLMVPFVLTRHIQEDAYITFRCAVNLADTGVYGFNPGERMSASSSHLSVFVAALLRTVFGRYFIPAVQVVYGAAAIAGIRVLAASLVTDPRKAARVWIAVALLPVSLMAAYGGMETGVLLLLTALAFRAVTLDKFSPSAAIAFALLPWVRPDAIAIGTIIVFVVVPSADRPRLRLARTYGLLLLAGAAAWLLFNKLYFGTLLTQTMIGKAAVWFPDNASHAAAWGLVQLKQILAGGIDSPGMFVPIATRRASWLAIPGALLVFGAIALLTARPSMFGTRRRPVIALALMAVAIPTAYAFGGIVYAWYLWPSEIAAWLLVAVLVAGALDGLSPRVRTVALSAAFSAVAFLVVAQWLLAVAWGTEERLYRGGIGERIRALSAPGDTLLLEPAGYIPFYAGLRTWDEIGLASPEVTQYRRAHRSRWWIRFVTDVRPTFLVEREHMMEGRTLDGYTLSPAEQLWFDRHYELVQTFQYDPDVLRSSAVLARIASLGSARTYLLYKSTYHSPDPGDR
jgi:hypothetical protein